MVRRAALAVRSKGGREGGSVHTVVIQEALRTRLLCTIAQHKPVEVWALVGRQLPGGTRDFLLLAVALPLPQGKKSEEKYR
jgi:hypothetical protein